jgi:hypothetical protein
VIKYNNTRHTQRSAERELDRKTTFINKKRVARHPYSYLYIPTSYLRVSYNQQYFTYILPACRAKKQHVRKKIQVGPDFSTNSCTGIFFGDVPLRTVTLIIKKASSFFTLFVWPGFRPAGKETEGFILTDFYSYILSVDESPFFFTTAL